MRTYDPLMVNIMSDEKLAAAKIGDLARSQGVGDCLDSVAYAVAEKLAQAEPEPHMREEFVRAFYAILPAEDLTAAGPKKLSAIALAQWRFMHDRPAGSLKLRLFNPSQEVDGLAKPAYSGGDAERRYAVHYRFGHRLFDSPASNHSSIDSSRSSRWSR